MQDAVHLEKVIRCETKKRAKVLAVASGKGGVGKTNISANLGLSLAARGQKVVLFDADLSLGNLDVILGIHSKYNIGHMLSGKKTLKEIIHIGPEGLEVICGVSGLEQLANLGEFQRQRMLRELSKLQEEADTIIIDMGAGIAKSVVGFCMASDHVLVVTTPEATAMTDAYAMIKVLAGNNFGGRISLIVNMAHSQREGKKTYQRISDVASKFLNMTIYDAGVLLKDDQLVNAVRKRRPVVLEYPKAKISASIGALAVRVGSGPAIIEKSGFFGKVADWLF